MKFITERVRVEDLKAGDMILTGNGDIHVISDNNIYDSDSEFMYDRIIEEQAKLLRFAQ
jgi:hypothetical protein